MTDAIGLPRVTPGEFVAALAARGLTLAADAAGRVVVAGRAELLTSADREVIAAHKTAIVAHLRSPGTGALVVSMLDIGDGRTLGDGRGNQVMLNRPNLIAA